MFTHGDNCRILHKLQDDPGLQPFTLVIEFPLCSFLRPTKGSRGFRPQAVCHVAPWNNRQSQTLLRHGSEIFLRLDGFDGARHHFPSRTARLRQTVDTQVSFKMNASDISKFGPTNLVGFFPFIFLRQGYDTIWCKNSHTAALACTVFLRLMSRKTFFRVPVGGFRFNRCGAFSWRYSVRLATCLSRSGWRTRASCCCCSKW